MITREQVPALLDHMVYDPDGKKIGRAAHVFLDDRTGEPEWASIRTGLFGSHESFVPIHDARLVEDHLEIPYSRSKVRDAPHVDVDSGGHLSGREERDLYRFYGVDWETETTQKPDRETTSGTAGAGGTERTTGMAPGAATKGTSEETADTAGTSAAAGTAGAMGARDAPEQQRGTAGSTQSGAEGMTRSEEQMRVHTERYESGHARLRKYVVTEDVEQTVPVHHEEVRVEHEPITDSNRDEALRGPSMSEDEYEVTLHEERPVTETETVPVERVRMVPEEHIEQQRVTGRVRKEQIEEDIPGKERPDQGGGKS